MRGFPATTEGTHTRFILPNTSRPQAFFRIAPPLAKARITGFSANGDLLTLSWSSQPGEHFDIEYSDNLADWSDLFTSIPSSLETPTSTQVFSKPASGRFFRVVSAKSKPLISRVAWLGDSITEGETQPDGRCHLLTGRLVHVLLDQRITPVANSIRGDWDFGWSGFTSQQLINGRPDLPGVFPVQRVINSGADTCVVHIGTNNITWGQPVDMIVSSISEVWDLLRAANITTIGTEITPRAGISSVEVVDDINSRLNSEARARGMIFAEWNRVGRLANGTADPKYYPDGLHPNAMAASAKAIYLADVFVRKATLLDYRSIGSIGNPEWITPNPAMASSGESPPNAWQSYPPANGTTEFSIVPSSGGGDPWLQLVVRQPEGAYGHGYLYITAQTVLFKGDRFTGTLELDSNPDWNFKEVSISIANVGNLNPRDLYVGGSGGIRDLQGPVSRYQGTLSIPTMTTVETSERAGFFINYYGSGTLRVRNAGILRVP